MLQLQPYFYFGDSITNRSVSCCWNWNRLLLLFQEEKTDINCVQLTNGDSKDGGKYVSFACSKTNQVEVTDHWIWQKKLMQYLPWWQNYTKDQLWALLPPALYCGVGQGQEDLPQLQVQRSWQQSPYLLSWMQSQIDEPDICWSWEYIFWS